MWERAQQKQHIARCTSSYSAPSLQKFKEYVAVLFSVHLHLSLSLAFSHSLSHSLSLTLVLYLYRLLHLSLFFLLCSGIEFVCEWQLYPAKWDAYWSCKTYAIKHIYLLRFHSSTFPWIPHFGTDSFCSGGSRLLWLRLNSGIQTFAPTGCKPEISCWIMCCGQWAS